MEDTITVVAGANNSGKTSLVELFSMVFGGQKGRFRKDDISADVFHKWSEQLYSIFLKAFQSGKTPQETLTDIFVQIESESNSGNESLFPTITLEVQVEYDEDRDDIRCFADYTMELSPENTSFYFIYQYGADHQAFKEAADAVYEKLKARFQRLTGGTEANQQTVRVIQDMLKDLYASACEETAKFADHNYENAIEMDVSAFKRLFHYQHIVAGRNLADERSDHTDLLSRNIISAAEQDEQWEALMRKLPDEILQPIQDSSIQEIVRETAIETLNQVVSEIAKTNGGRIENIAIDLEVSEDAIAALVRNITHAKFYVNDYYLSESSQGLGYSNLIYIHLQLVKFKKTIDPLIVNFFVIEEPESHMHPQMQNVFAQYLFRYYKKENQIQGMLTTHSHEVVRTASISQLRVLRQVSPFQCELFDLHEFQDKLPANESKDLLEFYNWFYTINFPDIVFADKIIMYEGDTEKMLIKKLLQQPEFDALRNQYVSFVQVGGAYGHKYCPLIQFLGIKSVLITDLDYDKSAITEDAVLASHTTNETIQYFSNFLLPNSSLTVKSLYDWNEKSSPIVMADTIYLAFQGEKDGFARTLEEAMLAKRYQMSALSSDTQEKWKQRRKEDKLKFVI